MQMNRVNNALPQIATMAAQTVSHPQNHDVTRPIDRPTSLEHGQQTTHVNDRQSQMEQSLKRSVTLVIWYKPNCDPVRLIREVSTFPLFQLSQYPSLVSDLELTSESYLDAYNVSSGHWEQHTITTVRTVESEQRLFYKLRRTLLSGLADDECKGLSEEFGLQSKRNQPTFGSPILLPASIPQLKRPLPAGAEVPSAKRFFVPESYSPHSVYIPPTGYMIPPQTIPYATPLASPPIAGPSQIRSGDGIETNTPTSSPFHGTINLQSPIISQTPLFSPNSPGLSTPPVARIAFPQQSHPPTKRWPNDYTVSEIAVGFRAMDAMIVQSSTITQRMAFERVFSCRYVKSTVCRHRAVYRKADPAVRTFFEDMGNNEKAVWSEFVRRVEGRLMTASKSKESGDKEGGSQTDLQSMTHDQHASLSPGTRTDSDPHQLLADMDQPHVDIPSGPLPPGQTDTH
ncbi:hypothetical protein V8B97DRAFT_1978346 [Scleroderma yunnanense]